MVGGERSESNFDGNRFFGGEGGEGRWMISTAGVGMGESSMIRIL